MRCEWHFRKISEIGTVVGGATPSTKIGDYWDGTIPWITPKDLTSNCSRYIDCGERSITEEGFSSCSTQLIPEGGILFSSRAPIGYVAIASNPLCTNQGFKSVVPGPEVDSLYLYYLLKLYAPSIELLGSGTTFKEVSGKTMADVLLPIPDGLGTQRRIASVLDAIDSKIELNVRINGYLQETGDAIFRRRFAHIRSNAVLSDVARVTMGQSPAGSSYNEDGMGSPFFQGRAEFGFRYPRKRLSTTEPKRMASAGDVLMSVRAPVGDLNVAYEDCCIGRGLAAIHSSRPTFCLYLMRSLRRMLEAYNGEGTVFGSISGIDLKRLPVPLPNQTEIDSFEQMVSPLDKEIRNRTEESNRLAALRDALLPRLMSGEIDVSRVDVKQLANSH